MQIFVTGGAGFIGGAVIRRMQALGHRVLAMSPTEATDAVLRALGAEPVRGDLATVAASNLAKCEAVVHCAAFVKVWGPRDIWHRTNVVGTQTMLAAAEQAGVKRFVHISSESALVRGQDLIGADENYPLAPNSPYPYCASKARSEALVRSANAPGRFETIVLRPRFVWGPGDTTLLPRFLEMARAGRWVWIRGGAALTSTTHVDNLVHAIELSLTRGETGAAYFVLDDGTVTIREIVTGMVASQGIVLPDRSIPRWLAGTLGWICERAWRLLQLPGEPPLTRHAAMLMSRECTLTDALARHQLGYAPVITREAGLEIL
jgi:nucleoside-diphosphate-sugar epimerase